MLSLYVVHIIFGGEGVLVLANDEKGAQDAVLKKYGLDSVWSIREIPGPFDEGSVLFEFNSTGKKLRRGSTVWEFTGPNRLTRMSG